MDKMVYIAASGAKQSLQGLALKANNLAGAGLDVFNQEPYYGPLTKLDNVILTPHIGAYAKELRIQMEIDAVENLIRGIDES